MTRLWCVRHGPTHARAMVGWTDVPADLTNVAQLRRVADYLPKRAAAVTSDLGRARTTADALGLTDQRLPDCPGLREIHFGDWEMKRFDEVDDPDLIRAFWDAPGDVAPPGGESWNTFSARVDRATDGLIAEGHNDIILVCHFGVIVRQVERALGVSPREAFGHKIANLSITRINAAPGGWEAAEINHEP